jgi:hypothetical protein
MDQGLLVPLFSGARAELPFSNFVYFQNYVTDKELKYVKAIQAIPHPHPQDILQLKSKYLTYVKNSLTILSQLRGSTFNARLEFRASSFAVSNYFMNKDFVLELSKRVTGSGFLCAVNSADLAQFKALKIHGLNYLAHTDRRPGVAHAISYILHALDSRPWDGSAWIKVADHYKINLLSRFSMAANLITPLEQEWVFETAPSKDHTFWKFTKASIPKTDQERSFSTVAAPKAIRDFRRPDLVRLIKSFHDRVLSSKEMFQLYLENICALVPKSFRHDDCPKVFLTSVLVNRHITRYSIEEPQRLKWRDRVHFLTDLKATLPRSGTHWPKMFCHEVLQAQMLKVTDNDRELFMEELYQWFDSLELLPRFEKTNRLWPTSNGVIFHLNPDIRPMKAKQSPSDDTPFLPVKYEHPFMIQDLAWLLDEKLAFLQIVDNTFLAHFATHYVSDDVPFGFGAIALSIYDDYDCWDQVRKRMALEVVDEDFYYNEYIGNKQNPKVSSVRTLQKQLSGILSPDDYHVSFLIEVMPKIAANTFARPFIIFNGTESFHVLPCRISPKKWLEPICLLLNLETKTCNLLTKKANPVPFMLIPPSTTDNFWHYFKYQYALEALYEYFNNSPFYTSLKMVPPKKHCFYPGEDGGSSRPKKQSFFGHKQ